MSRMTNRGTSLVPVSLFSEPEAYGNGSQQYQSISFQPEYSSFSHEELRVVDYQKRAVGIFTKQPLRRPTTTPLASSGQTTTSNNAGPRNRLDLLRGAAIRVCVGPLACACHCATSETCECTDSWYLPQALISHHSDFLEAACIRNFKEKAENRIELPNDDPATFALFVEWMYYGDYTAPVPKLFDPKSTSTANPHAVCYVLGDKLLSTAFKNTAMSHLYQQHTVKPLFPTPITTQDARYVWDNTAVGSKLRQFYLDYFAEHFANPSRLKGSTEEWDDLLLDYSDARLILLGNIRASFGQRVCVKAESEYLGSDERLGGLFGKMRLDSPAS